MDWMEGGRWTGKRVRREWRRRKTGRRRKRRRKRWYSGSVKHLVLSNV